jgi:hypothetical protein
MCKFLSCLQLPCLHAVAAKNPATADAAANANPALYNSWLCCAVLCYAMCMCDVQVDVLALPYYRHGKLVDLRYLHIVHRCLEASWLAAEACEPFLRDTHLQVRSDAADQSVTAEETQRGCYT